jgi:hypothetical protein
VGAGLIALFVLFGWGELQYARNARAEADATKALRSFILAEGAYSKGHGGAAATPACLQKPVTCAPPQAGQRPYLDPDWPGSWVERYFTVRFRPATPSAQGVGQRYALTLVRKDARDPLHGRNFFCGDSEGVMITGSDVSEPSLRDGLCDLSRILVTRAGDPKEREQAIAFLSRAADQGNLDAQAVLGGIYLDEGVPPDYEKALLWLRPAAEKGHPVAQCSLGVMYDKGQGVSQDQIQAVAWFRKAADQGDPRAQYNLALKYDQGQGVPADRLQALVWANVVMDEAEYEYRKKAAELRNELVATMTQRQIARAQALALQWEAASRRADRPAGRRDFLVDGFPGSR